MKNPNGYGTVKKLSGKRRKPWAIVLTTGWKYRDGKAIQKTKYLGYYESRREAMLALSEYNQKPYDVSAREMTVQEVYADVYETKIKYLKQSARVAYETAWLKCDTIRDKKIADIRRPDMQAIIDSHADMSASTLKNITMLLHLLFKYAMENDIADKDYSQYVTVQAHKGKKEKFPFTHDEIAKLFDDPKRNSYVIVLILTGLRASEYLSITPEDVDYEKRLITVNGTKTASAKRIIPIHKALIPLLKEDFKNKATSYSMLAQRFKALMKRLGMNHTLHECRHTFATLAQEYQVDPFVRKRILGHRTQDLTMDVYTHIYAERLVREVDKIVLEKEQSDPH